MGLLDGGLASVFGSIFSSFYLDAQLYRADLGDDGEGGGSTAFDDPEPVKAQLDKVIERMVGGNMEKLQSIFMLQQISIEGVMTAVAKPSTDDEITVGGTRWQIATVETDPVNAYFLLGGRKSPRSAAAS